MIQRFNHDERSTGAGRFLFAGMAGVLLISLCLTRPPRDEGGLVSAAEKETEQQAEALSQAPPISNRPVVAGKLRVKLRTRGVEKSAEGQTFLPQLHEEEWNVSETAVIICDMWDDHYCKLCAERVDAMAPRMNRVISAARAHGVTIIHAPSGCMQEYAETPYRRRMQQAPHAEPPAPIQSWCYLNADKEPKLPIDDSREPCDDPVVGARVRHFTKENPALKIIGYDGISDSGQEIYNHFVELGIKNVVLMGVHTNMCVLGRPFGIRQLKYLGINVVLARDLTDAMYDPREYPYVSHTRGTELVIEHIEKHWCPSIEGEDLTRVIPGSADPDLAAAKTKRSQQTQSTAQ